jgi:hypothetical protein
MTEFGKTFPDYANQNSGNNYLVDANPPYLAQFIGPPAHV